MIVIALALLGLLVLFGTPIAVAILGAGVLYLVGPDVSVSLTLVPLRMITSLNNFLLVAVPMFIFAGELMAAAGLTERLMRVADYLVGWLRAGLAQVNVAVSMLFGGISGMAMADAAAVGSVMIPAMRKVGYGAGFTAAVTGASSTVGPIIPPSIPAVIYGAIAGVSIGGLFLAGAIPGILLGLAFMVVVAVWARRRGDALTVTSIEHRSWGDFARTLRDGLLALMAPAIILAGIFTGIFTPTESSAIAVAYVTLIGTVFFRTLTWSGIVTAARKSVLLTSVILLIFSAAAVLSWGIAFARVPVRIIEALTALTTNPTMVLLLIAFALVIVGMVLDPMAAMIILVPILAPIGDAYGINALHLGLIVILTLNLGMITPPVGYILFIVAQIGETPVENVVREMLRFYIGAIALLLAVVLLPWLTTWLPGQLGF